MSIAKISYFLDLLDIKIVELNPGSAVLSLTATEKHTRSLGIMHGGVLATLIDSAMGISVTSLAPPDHYSVTVQMNVNFIRPAWPGESLIANGEVKHNGRQTAIAYSEVRTPAGVLVASGTGTFLYLKHTDASRSKIEQLPDNIIGESVN